MSLRRHHHPSQHRSRGLLCPTKGQLAILVLARLGEPLSERSLTSYLFYQLQWFDPQLSPAQIAQQAGYLTAVFAAAQCLTSMWWGWAADHPRLGRKRVLMIGLLGSSLSALVMGFSRPILCGLFLSILRRCVEWKHRCPENDGVRSGYR
jgi:MFS family permease